MKSYMQWFPRVLIGATFFFTTAALASLEEVEVKLEVLQDVRAQEASGDELYFSVTEFPSHSLPSHYQIPSYPTHWLSTHLANVKNIILWKKTFQQCENTAVLISLVEEDFLPWNLNDDLGSIQLNITCENGQVKTSWNIPDKKIATKIKGEENGFYFTGKNTKYHAVFKLEENKNPQPEKIESKF